MRWANLCKVLGGLLTFIRCKVYYLKCTKVYFVKKQTRHEASEAGGWGNTSFPLFNATDKKFPLSESLFPSLALICHLESLGSKVG